MIGVIIASHGRLAEELLSTAQGIVGPLERSAALCLSPGEGVQEIRARFEQALKQVDEGDGVLILTDMFGGTPSNVALSFLDETRVEVVTGVNLPMLLKLSTCRQDGPALHEVAQLITGYGAKNIHLASDLLRQSAGEPASPRG